MGYGEFGSAGPPDLGRVERKEEAVAPECAVGVRVEGMPVSLGGHNAWGVVVFVDDAVVERVWPGGRGGEGGVDRVFWFLQCECLYHGRHIGKREAHNRDSFSLGEEGFGGPGRDGGVGVDQGVLADHYTDEALPPLGVDGV